MYWGRGKQKQERKSVNVYFTTTNLLRYSFQLLEIYLLCDNML